MSSTEPEIRVRELAPPLVAELFRRKVVGDLEAHGLPLEVLVTPVTPESPAVAAADLEDLARNLRGCHTADFTDYLSPSWATVPYIFGAEPGSTLGPGPHHGWLAYLRFRPEEGWRVAFVAAAGEVDPHGLPT
jgi:hypothetical protein